MDLGALKFSLLVCLGACEELRHWELESWLSNIYFFNARNCKNGPSHFVTVFVFWLLFTENMAYERYALW